MVVNRTEMTIHCARLMLGNMESHLPALRWRLTESQFVEIVSLFCYSSLPSGASANNKSRETTVAALDCVE